MLSEIVANLFALAFNPATPAFNKEDIVIDSAFLQLDLWIKPWMQRLKIALTSKIRG